jgi:hypothetical protein
MSRVGWIGQDATHRHEGMIAIPAFVVAVQSVAAMRISAMKR